MQYDPTQFLGTAPFYLRGRPPYSAELGAVVAAELALDGTGVLVDVGAGPGTVALALGSLFGRIVVVEPDAGMLDEACTNLAAAPATFVEAPAEALPDLGLPPARAVTFGQSFHRVDRPTVAEAVYDLLEPGGALLIITHQWTEPPDEGPGEPPIPHDDIRALVVRYTGELRSGSRPVSDYVGERFEETVARTRFGAPRILRAPGRTDIVRDIDGVIAGVLSMSYASPYLLGERLDAFVGDLRDLLSARSPSGRFWDWPGDTEILLARRPGAPVPP